MSRAEIVDAYVAAVHGRDAAAMVALFEPDATIEHPTGTFRGPEEIAGFYESTAFAGRAVLEVGAVLADGPIVMAELAARSELVPDGDGSFAVDVFRLAEDGRIRTLDVYYR